MSNAKLLAASNAVSSKQAVEDDFKLQLGSTHMNWEHLLSPAPLSIGLLGDLMVMSSQTRDFPIDGELPRNGLVQYVKYPKSFRATLVQIGNEGQRAFMVAHNNMDKIRLLTADVPSYMKEATGILVQGDEELVADYLPAPMNRIREAAESSVSLSKAVVWQFENVMNLTSEVLEMCTSEKSVQEANLKKAIDRQKILNITIPSFQQMVSQLNESVVRDTEVMGRAEQDMRKALSETPSGWEMIGMDLVQKLGDVLTSTLSAVATVGVNSLMSGGKIRTGISLINEAIKIKDNFGGGGNNGKSASGDGNADYDDQGDSTTAVGNVHDPCVVQHKNPVLKVHGIVKNLRVSYSRLESIDSGRKGQYNAEKDSSALNDIANDIDSCDPLTDVINGGLEFVEQLAKLAKVQKPDNVTETEFKDRRTLQFNQLLSFGEKVMQAANQMRKSVMSSQQPVAYNTPLLSRARKTANAKGSASQQALANCRYRAEMAQATLESTRQSMERTRTLMMEQNQEFIKLLSEQQSLKLDEVRYDEIIKALKEGLLKLGMLKEHWTKLVMFFQKIANIVENVAAKSLEDFINYIDTTSQKLKNVHKDFVIDSLYVKALKATQATSLVNDMAEIYVNVSDRYIMPSVSSLSKLIVTDPKEASRKRNQLLAQCEEDSRAIVELILAEKTKTLRKVEQRNAQIKKEYAFLDQVKQKQIEHIRKETEQQLVKTSSGRKMTVAQRKTRVEEVVVKKIEADEFLRDNDILEDYESGGERPNADDF